MRMAVLQKKDRMFPVGYCLSSLADRPIALALLARSSRVSGRFSRNARKLSNPFF